MEEIQTPSRPDNEHFVVRSSKSDGWDTQAINLAEGFVISESLAGKFSPWGSCWIHLDNPDYDLLNKACRDLKLSPRLTASLLTSLENRGVRFPFATRPRDTNSPKDQTVLAKEDTNVRDTFDNCSPLTVQGQAICFNVTSSRVAQATNADGCLWLLPSGPKTLVSIYIAGQASASESNKENLFRNVPLLLRDLLAEPDLASSIHKSSTIIQQECREDRTLVLYQILYGIITSLVRRLGSLSGTGPGRFKVAITEFERIAIVLRDIQSGQKSNEGLVSTVCSQYINTLIKRIELDIVPMLTDAVEAKHENNLPDVLKSKRVPEEPIPGPLELLTFFVLLLRDTPAIWPWLVVGLTPSAILIVLANWSRLEWIFNSMFNDPELPNPFSLVVGFMRWIMAWPAVWPWIMIALTPCALLIVDSYRTKSKPAKKTDSVVQRG